MFKGSNKMIIAVDTREKKPYIFNADIEIKKLDIGDYSIIGLEDRIAIERKTTDDLINCLSWDRERFKKELVKSVALDYFALIIEDDFRKLHTGRYISKMNPKSAIESIMTFSVRYKIPVFFAGDRVFGQIITESLLNKYFREIEKANKIFKYFKNKIA